MWTPTTANALVATSVPMCAPPATSRWVLGTKPMPRLSALSWCTLIRLAVACVLLPFAGLVAANAAAPATAGTRVPQPVIEAARGGQCVADPAFMRRNHMDLLKHQRDDTLRGGVRTGQHSLKACIGCHASQSTGSVNAAET